MKVSVVIASYGDERWKDVGYSRALPSAMEAEPFEVLIEHFPEGDINFSRNALAKRAKGDWLCFLDADDELDPGYFAAMEAAYVGTAHLYTPAVSIIVGHGRRHPPKFYGEVDLRGGNWLIIGTLIERKLFRKIGGFRDWPHGLEDWDLWARAHYHGAQPLKVPAAIYVQHREGPSSHAVASRQPFYRPTYDAIIASHQKEFA